MNTTATTLSDLSAHRRAQDAFAAVVARLADDQLPLPTSCTEWTVLDVIRHVIGGNQRVSGSDGPAAEGVADLRAELARSAGSAQSTFEAPDGLTRTFSLPIGDLPGAVFIQLRTTDVLTHAWDLARATGQSTDLDPELSRRMLDFSRATIRADFRGEGRPFGSEQACAEERPAADRLAAFLGRAV